MFVDIMGLFLQSSESRTKRQCIIMQTKTTDLSISDPISTAISFSWSNTLLKSPRASSCLFFSTWTKRGKKLSPDNHINIWKTAQLCWTKSRVATISKWENYRTDLNFLERRRRFRILLSRIWSSFRTVYYSQSLPLLLVICFSFRWIICESNSAIILNNHVLYDKWHGKLCSRLRLDRMKFTKFLYINMANIILTCSKARPKTSLHF